MDFSLTPTQIAIRDTVRKFVKQEVRPVALERDRIPRPEDAYPWDLVRKAARLGLRTLALPRELGGGGADFLTLLVVCEELAYGDLGVAESFDTTLSWSAVMSALMNEEQQKRFIPPFLADETFMLAQGLTEPHWGSDNILPNEDPKTGISTTARRDGNGWVLNGTKSFISNGNTAKLVFITARTDPTKDVVEGCSLFAVPAGTPGFRAGTVEHKSGQRLNNNAELILEDCRVPHENLIGEVGKGLQLLGRLGFANTLKTAAVALGVARAAYEDAVEYAKTRVQGSRPIIEHQAVGMMLADMLMKIEAARSMTWRAGWGVDHDPNYDPKLSFMTKVFATEMVVDVTLRATEILGRFGTCVGVPVEKYHRDALTLLHSAGTQQVLLIKTANSIAGKTLRGWASAAAAA
jgi:alkylation response protein AidB-like acyl-CoA dehydrogenase